MNKMKNDLRKALEVIAMQHSAGVASNDTLIKACELFKIKTDFIEDLDYELKVTKSCFDYINDIPQDEIIAKSIVPGQTKMVDGIMYIYTATPNAKTDYDWRVLRKGTKGVSVGRNDSLDDEKIKQKQKFINSLFPKDLSTLKVIKQLGGSTGAKLVEDINGNQYVMKRGKNTNSEHVKSEYMANQLYNTLGMRTPDYELYDDNGEAVLLSRYIPMTRDPQVSDYEEMSKGFIADTLLANWDVYKNDNCLIDSAGRVLRVDNGGSLFFRARGDSKIFDSDVFKSYKGMMLNNPAIFSKLSDDDILTQIKEVRKNKDNIVNFLRESGEDKLADIIEKRIDNLKQIEDYVNTNKYANKPNTNPRQLKTSQDMYKKFTEDELKDIWDKASGKTPWNKLTHIESDSIGWDLLNTICKERGFDARPRVVSDTEFWNHVKSLPKDMPMMARGVSSNGGLTASNYANKFKHDDTCYYGSVGIYAEGIYAHIFDGNSDNANSNNYTNKRSYQDAYDYAGRDVNGVMLLAYEQDAKIINTKDLLKQLESNPPIVNSNTKKLEDEKKQIKAEIDKAENALIKIKQDVEDSVFKKMHYDELSIAHVQMFIDITDWGKIDLNTDEYDFPSFDDVVLGEFARCVRDNGGTVTISANKGKVTFQMPNDKEELSIMRYSYELQNSIRRRNAVSPAYHLTTDVFMNWLTRTHISKVEKELNSEMDKIPDKVNKIKQSINSLKDDYNKKEEEIRIKSNPDPNESLYNAIYAERHHPEVLGVYAAMLGYDGLYQNNGNGSGHGYAIILNRSKIVVKQ